MTTLSEDIEALKEWAKVNKRFFPSRPFNRVLKAALAYDKSLNENPEIQLKRGYIIHQYVAGRKKPHVGEIGVVLHGDVWVTWENGCISPVRSNMINTAEKNPKSGYWLVRK